MVVAYATGGPAESGGRLSVPVGDWWAFVEGCDLLEVAELWLQVLDRRFESYVMPIPPNLADDEDSE